MCVLFGTSAPRPAVRQILSLLSPAYKLHPNINCLLLFWHMIPCAFVFAFESAGSSMLARIAMMAITTSSSIKVKPRALAAGGPDSFITFWGLGLSDLMQRL